MDQVKQSRVIESGIKFKIQKKSNDVSLFGNSEYTVAKQFYF